MPQVKSAVNGLIINIPADAAGVVRRFASDGDNELIFDKSSLSGKQTAKASAPVKIGSEPKGRARPRSAEALA